MTRIDVPISAARSDRDFGPEAAQQNRIDTQKASCSADKIGVEKRFREM